MLDGKAMEGALSTQGSVKLFVSFAPYKLVLKNSIAQMEKPALACVQLVYDELVRMVGEKGGQLVVVVV